MLTQLLLDTGIHSDFFWTREHNTGRCSDGIVVFLFCGAYESCVRRRLMPATLLGMRFSRQFLCPSLHQDEARIAQNGPIFIKIAK